MVIVHINSPCLALCFPPSFRGISQASVACEALCLWVGALRTTETAGVSTLWGYQKMKALEGNIPRKAMDDDWGFPHGWTDYDLLVLG